MSIRDDYLEVLDFYRGSLDEDWDLRRYSVEVVVRSWGDGVLPGTHGATMDETITPLEVGDGKRPKVAQLTQKEVVASGGRYQDQDLRIGPLTPSWTTGEGTLISDFDPPITEHGMQILFRLKGPGLPVDGSFYRKVGQEVTSNFRYSVVVRKIGVDEIAQPVP